MPTGKKSPILASSTASAANLITPDYWDEACQYLSQRDRVMSRLIPLFGQARLQSRGDPFTTLARAIVGQQISVKSAQAVWDRLMALFPTGSGLVEPAQMLICKYEDLRGVGLPGRKVDYLVDLALHFQEQALHPQQWDNMNDEAIVEELTDIRGIGRWTAEMFLIFYLMRPNILPLDDIGLIKGISVNYFSGESVSRAEARELGEGWAPYRSVATWYLWSSLDPIPVEY